MVQKFGKNDELEEKFFAVWEGLVDQTFQDLQDFFDNVEKSPELGTALYDANSVEVWNILEKSFFVKIFDQLISSGYTAGAIDTYCMVIYALFGEDTEITIETNPLEITIGIVAEYTNTAVWRSRFGNVMTTRGGNVLAFRTLLVNIPRSQLNSLLRAITNAGTKVNFNLN